MGRWTLQFAVKSQTVLLNISAYIFSQMLIAGLTLILLQFLQQEICKQSMFLVCIRICRLVTSTCAEDNHISGWSFLSWGNNNTTSVLIHHDTIFLCTTEACIKEDCNRSRVICCQFLIELRQLITRGYITWGSIDRKQV